MRGYSDADYAGDNNTQKSVTGYIVLVNGEVISWRLKSHKTVTLSVYRSLIFINQGGMLQNDIFPCNFIVYGGCC